MARSYGKSFDELYEYDELNQLKKFHRGLLVDGNTVVENPGLQQGWQFDATGNWANFTTFDPADTTKMLDQQRLHNRVNEITKIARTVGANWVTPAYDRNGNMTGDETGKVFVYDAWNRLKIVKDAEGATLKTYSYDALSRRMRDDDGNNTTDLYYSTNWQVLEERVASEVINQYVWSLTYIDTMVLRDRATVTPGTLEERLWVAQDANWNVVGLMDGTGAVVERYVYDAFGVRTVLTPSFGSRGTSSYAWTQGFQGMFFDNVSGLSRQRTRWYSPSLGRWVTTDPLLFAGGDNNLYRFVGNSPINFTDWLGLIKTGEHFGFAYLQQFTNLGLAADLMNKVLGGLGLKKSSEFALMSAWTIEDIKDGEKCKCRVSYRVTMLSVDKAAFNALLKVKITGVPQLDAWLSNLPAWLKDAKVDGKIDVIRGLNFGEIETFEGLCNDLKKASVLQRLQYDKKKELYNTTLADAKTGKMSVNDLLVILRFAVIDKLAAGIEE